MRHPEYDVLYHSTHGALSESQHVFIGQALDYYVESRCPHSVSVFEMGFGTGLNALLAAHYCKEKGITLNYLGLEKYLVSSEIIHDLELHEILPLDDEILSFFNSLHTDLTAEIGEIRCKVLEGDFSEFEISPQSFDIIFFDAFGPRTQPDLWTVEAMKKMYDALIPGGILTTFCAQGEFRRNLQAAGFEVERIPGPPGKRHMTRARKPE